MSVAPQLKKVPPDGGWGWCIVLGSSVINTNYVVYSSAPFVLLLCVWTSGLYTLPMPLDDPARTIRSCMAFTHQMFTRAIEPSFGLLFRDLLQELNVETTGAAVVMGTMDSVINFSGLFVGPLMKSMSYRKVAMIGAVLTAVAYIGTVTANSLTHLIITFSIIGGIGFGFANASTFVGLNSYFEKRKAQAVGLAMAGTAAGFMVMPQIVSYLLRHYEFRGTLVIMSALCLNTFVGASLFQPVKWHLKTVKPDHNKEEKALLDDQNTIKEEDEEEEEGGQPQWKARLELTQNMTSSAQALPRPGQPNLKRQASLATNLKPLESFASLRKMSQVPSSASLNRRPSMMSHVSLLDFAGSTVHIDYQNDDRGLEMKLGGGPGNSKEQQGWLSRMVKVMDFDLLKDPIYLNILYGCSITYVSEFSWKLIVPFFMYNLGYDLQQTASALSLMSVADIIARVTMPPLLDKLPYSRRTTMMTMLVVLAVSRSAVAVQTENIPLMVALITHGFIRGVTLIGFPLVLSEYANQDNFPAVLGLSMVAKGIFIAIAAPIFGWVRDYTQSYPLSLHFQSVMIISCTIAWGTEYIIVKKKSGDEVTRS